MNIESEYSSLTDLLQTQSTLQNRDLAAGKTGVSKLELQQQVSLGMMKQAMEAPKQILQLISDKSVDIYA